MGKITELRDRLMDESPEFRRGYMEQLRRERAEAFWRGFWEGMAFPIWIFRKCFKR